MGKPEVNQEKWPKPCWLSRINHASLRRWTKSRHLVHKWKQKSSCALVLVAAVQELGRFMLSGFILAHRGTVSVWTLLTGSHQRQKYKYSHGDAHPWLLMKTRIVLKVIQWGAWPPVLMRTRNSAWIHWISMLSGAMWLIKANWVFPGLEGWGEQGWVGGAQRTSRTMTTLQDSDGHLPLSIYASSKNGQHQD